MPSPFEAEMGTTGMPSSCSISFTRTVPPLPSTSSIMFRANTMGTPSSISCMRQIQVAFHVRGVHDVDDAARVPFQQKLAA